MRKRSALYLSVAAIAIAAVLGGAPAQLNAQQAAAVSIGNTDLGGVVSGPNGPEAGVWVIAETTDLPTKMAKIVVTDDQGRYVMPDLPKANYSVWVRGYGLIDSPKVETTPGKILNLTSVPAPNEAAAAEYYPPVYWLSMLNVPTKSRLPGHRSHRQRDQSEHQVPAPVPARVQDRWLLPLPCHRHQGDAHAFRQSSASSPRAMRPGPDGSSPARPARTWSRPSSITAPSAA